MRIGNTLFLVADTETSGLDPKDSDLLEIGAVLVSASGVILANFETLVAPTKPLMADNSAIHGLIDEDFEGAPSLCRAFDKFLDFATQCSGRTVVDPVYFDPVYVFHNAQFDVGFLPMTACRRVLCTKRLAGHLCKDAPNTKNQTLRYFFRDVARDPAIRALGDAHRALGDARVTAAILPHLIDRYFAAGHPDDIDALIAFANSPVRIDVMPFGKHKGERIDDLAIKARSADYLHWMLRDMKDLDADLRFSIEAALGLQSVPV